jgi:dihydrofolate synthase/folylpolyglutamate synthase
MAMDYDAAIAYLDSHINLERSTAVAGQVRGLSLERIEALCHVLGDPQHAVPTIHITGTNGKGSTARMVSALIVEHDLSVGTYTSPHLERLNERIARNLEPISDDDFAEAIRTVASVEPLSGVEPSYFDLLTATALTWFAGLPVDVAVVEVGLLGRWDATNVVNAQIAVLTNVGKDHTDAEGAWRARIAEEKAGIVKPGSTFVLGETDPELRSIFDAAGAERLWVRDEDFGVERSELAVGGRVIDVRTPNGLLEDVFLPLHGAHQADNAAVAIAAVEAFFDRALDRDLVASALAPLRMPCRLEVVQRHPLVVLDGAHNPDGARTVATALDEEFTFVGTRHVVLGILDGRDPIEMAEALDLQPDDVIITTAPNSPRAIPDDVLAVTMRSLGLAAEPGGDVAHALDLALARATTDDLVLVTGSLYTAGDARAACRARGLIT